MLEGLDAPLLAGTQFPITLKFRDAGAVTVPVKVASPP
jgi:copper(I)-binding protein